MYIRGVFFVLLLMLLSGCALPGQIAAPTGPAFMRSDDNGVTFTPKVTIDEKNNFSAFDIIAMTMSSQDTRTLWLGLKGGGIVVTTDKGDHWRKLPFAPTDPYGLVSDSANPLHLIATGIYQGRGKIYRSFDAGETWDEVYTEPANGTVITALVQNPFQPLELYAGTSAGVIIRTNDGGNTWKNITFGGEMNGQMIKSIVFDAKTSQRIYFFTKGKGIFVSDGEKILADTKETLAASGSLISSNDATSFAFDPQRNGTFYMGTQKGLFRSTDFGKKWEPLNIIESSKKYPIRAIAINPINSSEIVYISALALYKSTDNGVHWSTHPLAGNRPAGLIQYDPKDPQTLYIGFRS